MNENSDFEQKYFEAVSSLGEKLFSEYLSVSSRERQRTLLLSAAITILVAFAIINPTEGSLVGIKFNISNIKVLLVLCGIVSFYFVITYLIGVLQDWQHFKYQQMPLTYQMTLVRNELVKRLNARAEAHQEINGQLENLFTGSINERAKLLSELTAKKQSIPNDKTLFPKIKLMYGVVAKYQWLRRVNLFIEIIFPVAFGLFAIILAVWMNIK